MTSNLTKEEIEVIRQVSIHDILGVQNSGRMVMVRCPFHNEKTGSCAIYPDNSFYCYGCKAKGQNAIDFCTSMGFSFVDACSELMKYIK